MLKKMSLIFMLATVIAGCNTVSGFGEDVQHVGGSIERTAN